MSLASDDLFRIHTVLPAKVTLAPVFKPVKRIVELAGAEMLDKTMLVHDATAEVIWE
jgi:hypothetical protein